MSSQTKSPHPRMAKILDFIKTLRVEPFTFAMLFQHGLKGMPNFLIIQDKICMQWYNTTYDYCRNLPTIQEDSSGPGLYKTQILSDAIQMDAYTTYVHLLPSLVFGLLIGAWIDQFNRGRKWLLVIFCIAGMVEILFQIFLVVEFDASPYINVFLSIPTYLLTGGTIGFRVAITHYITATTPPKLMAVRFMIFEICVFLALPIGYALAGYIIVQPLTIHIGQTHNYITIYVISLAIEVAALLWLIFMVDEGVAQKHQKIVEIKLRERCKSDATDIGKRVTDQSHQNVHPLKLLLNWENARTMLRTFFKNRPNKGRTQILLAVLSMSILFSEQIALGSLNSQFTQRVYYWNPDHTAYMNAVSMITGSVTTMMIIPIMTRVFDVWDISLVIVGLFVNAASNLIKGCWLSENGYYLAMGVSSIGGMSSICMRSHIAKIVDRDEQGKIMAVMAIADTISPVIATTLLAQIFRITVEKYPGTVFNVIAGIIFVPFCSMIWIFFCTERQAIDGVNNELESNEKQELNGVTDTRM